MKQFVWGAVFGVSCTLAAGAMAAITPEAGKALDRFSEALDRVQENYIEEPGYPSLIDKAIDGMLARLDPHSSYLTPEAYAKLSAPRPRQAAVGMELTADSGLIRVIAPIDGSPAAAAGIRAGDVILAINDEAVGDLPLYDVIDRLRGTEGSDVPLIVRHAAGEPPQTITLKRAFIEVEAVKFERKGDVGYIRPGGLSENVTDQLHEALRSLRKQIGPKLKGYIVDLRNNPGGLLDQAIQFSDEFLSSGNIVSTRGRHPVDTLRYDARGGGLFEKGDTADGKPVIILVNQGTAAGAEIIAAALQDHKRATILGMRTFGSGTIQTIIPLKAGGALRLTTSKFYRPSGTAMQIAGVTPDVVVAQSATDGEQADWPKHSEAKLPGHFSGEAPQAASPPLRPDPSKSYQDFQLETAMERLNALPSAKP